MSDPEIDDLVRAARSERVAAELGPCAICGSSQSLSVVAGQSRCYEHRRGREPIIELDHVAGVANLPGLTLAIRANAHRRATDILQALLRSVRAFSDAPLDDLTVVVLKQLAAPARAIRPAPLISSLKPAGQSAEP